MRRRRSSSQLDAHPKGESEYGEDDESCSGS
jgi:hypothetical protein